MLLITPVLTMSNNSFKSSKGSSSVQSENEEDVATRRRKNRVNAQRSRERKRLVLDTLQQEHWQLHQENKRMKTENDQLREAIAAVKSAQKSSPLPQPRVLNRPAGLQGLFPGQAPHPSAQKPSQQPAAFDSQRIIELVSQQLAVQQALNLQRLASANKTTPQASQGPPQMDSLALLGLDQISSLGVQLSTPPSSSTVLAGLGALLSDATTQAGLIALLRGIENLQAAVAALGSQPSVNALVSQQHQEPYQSRPMAIRSNYGIKDKQESVQR